MPCRVIVRGKVALFAQVDSAVSAGVDANLVPPVVLEPGVGFKKFGAPPARVIVLARWRFGGGGRVLGTVVRLQLGEEIALATFISER